MLVLTCWGIFLGHMVSLGSSSARGCDDDDDGGGAVEYWSWKIDCEQ